MNTNVERREKTGIPGFDTIACGGLIPQRLYLLDGDPGAGKTTFSLQYLLEGVKQGERCLYVTLSETRDELLAGAASHGWTLDGIEIVELAADTAELDGENDLTMLSPSEVELSESVRKVLAAVEDIEPTRMVFDSLSELRLLAQSSLRYRRQILALKQFFVGRKCTVILLDDRTAEGPDLQLHSIAHAVISLESAAPAYGKVRRELRILKYRGSDFVSGLHDFVIRRGGICVFPRLVASEHSSSFERFPIASGVAALDALLGGGVNPGTSTLLIGPPGCGKSTLAFQYAAAAAARNDHAAAFIFDETKGALLTRSSGLGFHFREGTGPGELLIRQVDPSEVSPGEFAAVVRDAVENNGARVVIIDSLNGYLNAMPQNNYLISQLHELLSYLNNHGVATFLVVAHTGLMGSNMMSPIDASYLADSVVLFRYFEHGAKVRKAISVVKKRTGPHEESIRGIWFDEGGLHLSEPLLELRGVLTGSPVEISAYGQQQAASSRSHDE
jgi:circadian clock protein KaiC